MATAEFSGTVGTVTASAGSANLIGSILTKGQAVGITATHAAAVNTDVATLVADGATPTQAHVNTLNTDWTAMKADMAALQTAITALTADISLYIGSIANVADMNKLRSTLKAIVTTIQGSGLLAAGSGSPRSL